MTKRQCFSLEEVLSALNEDRDFDDIIMEGSDDEFEDLQEEANGKQN